MTGRKTARSCSSKSRVQPSASSDAVDVEMNCLICQRRLYVPVASIEAVLASLEQTGVAILVCPAGHAQLIWREQPTGRQLHA